MEKSLRTATLQQLELEIDSDDYESEELQLPDLGHADLEHVMDVLEDFD